MARSVREAFAVWLTGIPASGKSTIARALEAELNSLGFACAVLESDALRKVLTPNPRYDEQERDVFYSQIADIGLLLVRHRVPVIFDATANRRAYRDHARRHIPRFLEVFVSCPLEVCMARDPKGIYRMAVSGATTTAPGLQTDYEAPLHPDIEIRGDEEAAESAAHRIIKVLNQKGLLE